MDVYKYSVNF